MRNPFKPKTPKVTTSQVDPGAIWPYRGSIKESYSTDCYKPAGKKVVRKS